VFQGVFVALVEEPHQAEEEDDDADVREKTEHGRGPEDRRYLKFDRNSTSGPFPFSGTSPALLAIRATANITPTTM
jgi:hypothetical protein